MLPSFCLHAVIEMITVILPLLLPLLILWFVRDFGRRGVELPPGPPTTLLIGNVREFAKTLTFLQLTRWAAVYGDIFSLKLMNQTIVVLSSPRAVREVLDKQGHSTGDRPSSYMTHLSEGIYPVIENMDTHVWKASRKAFHAFLSNEALRSYWPMQRVEYLQLLNDILDSPENLYTHVKRTTASIMIALVYGKRMPLYKGSKAELWYEGMARLNHVGAHFEHPPVDAVPLLRYVPARWAKWKTLCEETKRIRGAFDRDLIQECEEVLRTGRGITGCFMEKVLGDREKFELSREEARSMCRALLDGGIETSATFLHSFLLALVCYPKCQLKAHEEIDRIIGGDRLPTLEDYEDLPYVRALVKEVHRFRTVVPLGVPHVASRDVRYKERLIPQGSVIFMNTWGILHDPEIYDDPDSFMPERYLHSEYGVKAVTNTDGFRDTLPFGAGRRICPGVEMASRSSALNVMNLLWAFKFTKHDSGTGTMDLESDYLHGLELQPKHFTCKIKPRSVKHVSLIKEAYENAIHSL